MRPSNVGTKTTSRATVVQPNGGECKRHGARAAGPCRGRARSRADRVRGGVVAAKLPGPIPPVAFSTITEVDVGERTRARPTKAAGVSIPPSRPGHTGTLRSGERAPSRCCGGPRGGSNVERWVVRSHATTLRCLARADDEVADHGRVLETWSRRSCGVTWSNQRSAPSPEPSASSESVCRATGYAAPLGPCRPAPRDRVRGPDVQIPVDERRRLPRASAAGRRRMRPRPRIVSNRNAPRRRGVQRIDRPPRTRAVASRRGRDEPAYDERRESTKLSGPEDAARPAEPPVASSSAKTRSSVLPYTTPRPRSRDRSGPASRVEEPPPQHSSVVGRSAKTLLSMSCTYTTPSNDRRGRDDPTRGSDAEGKTPRDAQSRRSRSMDVAWASESMPRAVRLRPLATATRIRPRTRPTSTPRLR